MNAFPEGADATVEIEFTDLNGNAVEPTSVTVAIYDQDEELIADIGAISFTPGVNSMTYTIGSQHNQLSGVADEIRVVRITIETSDDRVLRQKKTYIVAGERKLAVMENSFMTAETAELLSRAMVNVQAYTAASEDMRYAALVQAYERLTRVRMGYRDGSTNVVSRFDAICDVQRDTVIDAIAWKEMTKEEFLALPQHFIAALRNAQILEANEILSGDDIARRQRAGIISETVGESSIMLRNGVLDHGVSSLALRALSGFIRYNFRVQR